MYESEIICRAELVTLSPLIPRRMCRHCWAPRKKQCNPRRQKCALCVYSYHMHGGVAVLGTGTEKVLQNTLRARFYTHQSLPEKWRNIFAPLSTMSEKKITKRIMRGNQHRSNKKCQSMEKSINGMPINGKIKGNINQWKNQ